MKSFRGGSGVHGFLRQRQLAKRCRSTTLSLSDLATAAVSRHPGSRVWVCAWRSLSRGDFGGPAIFRLRPRHGARQCGSPAARRSLGDPTGLYYLSVGKGLTVFGASGLGGGSLINAGVVLRPSLDRLRKAGWPDAVVSDGLLLKGLARAEAMLGVAPVPGPERFAKFAGMRKAAEASGLAVQLPAMTISHSPGVNAAGVMQYACRYCGDCWSGCNVGAKNTVGITYIADAVDHGATVFCESRAQSISKTGSRWGVLVQDLSKPGVSWRIEAPIVVLAAGTLGTNELLLRAQRRGLKLSAKAGREILRKR